MDVPGFTVQEQGEWQGEFFFINLADTQLGMTGPQTLDQWESVDILGRKGKGDALHSKDE